MIVSLLSQKNNPLLKLKVLMADLRPSRWKISAAFLAVYGLWGSTYLAIGFAIKTLPPFLMAGFRFLIAGSILCLWARLRGAARPQAVHWRSAFLIGLLLLLGGNGGVVWAQQFVPSSVAAVLVATVPLWMVVLQRFSHRGSRLGLRVGAGLLLGLGGVGLLAAPDPSSLQATPPAAAAVLLAAALSWAAGSLLTRELPLPESSALAIGMQMLCGSAALLAAAWAAGDFGRFNPSEVSLISVVSLVYLIIFGALAGFSCYLWLVRVTPPYLSSTYAYVNPAVAVFLGWLIGGENLSGRLLIGAAVILTSVAMILLGPPADLRK